ncbi:MAG: alanyl-tRNA editing protein [archaeon]
MTERLYLKDSYLRGFEARIVKANEGKFFVLDKTAFYPQGGGQPSDSGKIIADGKEYNVVFAKAFGDEISHEIEGANELSEGRSVKAELDWERRYKLMRMHTAAHVLAKCIYDKTGSLITGNQLGERESRMDFNVSSLEKEFLGEIEGKANEAIAGNLEVKMEFLPREEALAIPELFRLKDVLPKALQEFRIISIGEFDRQADGGTHVKNTREVGKLRITRHENKGANNRRIYFLLEP